MVICHRRKRAAARCSCVMFLLSGLSGSTAAVLMPKSVSPSVDDDAALLIPAANAALFVALEP